MQQLHVSVCRASGLRALPHLQARVIPSSLNAGSSSARVGPVRAYSKQPYCHIKPHRSPMVGHITNRSACLVVFNDAPPQCSTGPRVLLLHALPRGSQAVSAILRAQLHHDSYVHARGHSQLWRRSLEVSRRRRRRQNPFRPVGLWGTTHT